MFFLLGFRVRDLPAIAFNFDNFKCRTACMRNFQQKKRSGYTPLSRQATHVDGKEVGTYDTEGDLIS